MEIKSYGLNSLLVEGAKILLSNSEKRVTRGYTCHEINEPVTLVIENPKSRIITLKSRQWNPFLPFIESLWILLGRNDLEFVTNYVSSLGQFSDDNRYMRAGYGPRIRAFNGADHQYEFPNTRTENKGVDQIRYCVAALLNDQYSRRAIMSFGDPNKDCFENNDLRRTKDFPCTQSLQFIVNSNGELDAITTMRSNDFLWGSTAVDIFNYTLIQELIAGILAIPVGKYYHFASNLHYYEQHKNRLMSIASSTNYDVDTSYVYSLPQSLKDLDSSLNWILSKEILMRKGEFDVENKSAFSIIEEWLNVIQAYYTKSDQKIKSPYLANAIRNKFTHE